MDEISQNAAHNFSKEEDLQIYLSMQTQALI